MSFKNPNLFIIGAPKSGTTALAYNLSASKDIFLPKIKEPRYFDAHVFYDCIDDYPVKSLDDYLSYYENEAAVKSKYRLDASVFNMYSIISIKNILKLQPDSKFIVMLREPVSASVSMHKQRLKYPAGGMREVSDDFTECWKMLDDRRKNEGYPKNCKNRFLFRYDLLYSYEKYLPDLISVIPEKQLFIGFYEDYLENNSFFIEKVFSFLNLENQAFENRKVNESYTLKDSIVLNCIMRLVSITLPLRKKLNLTGSAVSSIKKLILKRYITESENKKYDLSEVEEYFEKTNSYLKVLKSEYQ